MGQNSGLGKLEIQVLSSATWVKYPKGARTPVFSAVRKHKIYRVAYSIQTYYDRSGSDNFCLKLPLPWHEIGHLTTKRGSR